MCRYYSRCALAIVLLLAATAYRASAANFTTALVGEDVIYSQTSSAPPIATGFQFFGAIEPPYSQEIPKEAGSTISFNSNTWLILRVPSPDGTLFGTYPGGGSIPALEQLYDGTTHTLQVGTVSNGIQNFPITLGTSDDFTPAYITNYTALQAANLAGPLTIDFSSSAGPGVLTKLDVTSVSGTNFYTHLLTTPTGGSLTIPAGTLLSGWSDVVDLSLFDPTSIDTTTESGATVYTGYQSDTVFTLGRAVPLPPAVWSALLLLTGIGTIGALRNWTRLKVLRFLPGFSCCGNIAAE